MVTWLEMARQYPEAKGANLDHLTDNITVKQGFVSFESKTVGFWVKMRDQSKAPGVKDYARYFINLAMAEIEDLQGEIENDRREIREITGL